MGQCGSIERFSVRDMTAPADEMTQVHKKKKREIVIVKRKSKKKKNLDGKIKL